jgi:hypothetical protein
MPPVGVAPMEFFSYEGSKKMNGRKVRSISAIAILGMALMTGSTVGQPKKSDKGRLSDHRYLSL